MRKYSSLLGSSGMAMGLTAAAIAIAVILLSSNFTIINAQSQQQVTGQTGEQIENGTTAGATTTFQSTNDDSFSVQVPQGWVIQDVNNTGPALSEEMTLGYAILAQLCPEEQQRAVPSNASISTTSCQGAQDVIHIIRYPDLDTRLLVNNVTTNNTTTTIDNILTYHLQKLQEVGSRGRCRAALTMPTSVFCPLDSSVASALARWSMPNRSSPARAAASGRRTPYSRPNILRYSITRRCEVGGR